MICREASSRRGFLQASATGLVATSLGGAAPTRDPQRDGEPQKNSGGIPLRPFGRTGEMVAIIGLGGSHVTNPGRLSEADSVRLIQRAVDEGITFMDNAWEYHGGEGELRMGKALAQGNRREQVFLMTKGCGRTAKEARSNLEDSLKRLQTDRLDLWQFHEVVYDNDPDWIFAAEGAIEAGLKAIEEGKIRYLGFTGHKDPRIHAKMLAKPFDWAAVQLPLNVMDAHYRSFQKEILPKLVERGIAPIGMKSLGGDGRIVGDGGVSAKDALGYVLSLPVATLVVGIDSEKVLDENLSIVRSFQPFDEENRVRVEGSVAAVAGDGRFERFKSTQQYDSGVHRGQHGMG